MTPPGTGRLELVLKNSSEGRQALGPALAQFAAEHRLSPSIINPIDLALEEHLTNICNHGYTDSAEHTIIVRIAVSPSWLDASVEDDGVPFDPRSYPPVDTTVPLERRPIGGLGIHMIRKSVDELDYRREGGKNVLVLRKRVADTKQ